MAKGVRNSYVVEREGIFPQVVFEVTSESTAENDRTRKQTVYETDFKAEEYFQFDPRLRVRDSRLSGLRLVEGGSVSIPEVEGRLQSRRLGLEFVARGWKIEVYNSTTGERLLRPEEEAQARVRAEQARVRAELARARAELAQARAEAETERLQALLRQSGIEID